MASNSRLPPLPRPPKTPRIEYVTHPDVDDAAPTLKRPALDRRAAESVLALSNRPSTIPPLTIDATVERFVASPLPLDDEGDASHDDWTPPPLPVSAGARALGLVALFVAIAFSSAILGAAAARVSAKGNDVELHWVGVELPRR